MDLEKALEIATQVKGQLAPHCERVEIAGSIRRRKPEVKDIEIVCIPKPFETGLFASGIATVVNQWPKIKGEMPCKYTQRLIEVPQEPYKKGFTQIKLDLFFADTGNWGLIYAIRTGSAEYSHKVLATGWTKKGYSSKDGWLHRADGTPIAVPQEEDLFRLIGVEWVKPEERNY